MILTLIKLLCKKNLNMKKSFGKAVAINTHIGYLNGRDCIYLRKVIQDEDDNLIIECEFNGRLVSSLKNDEWLNGVLTFKSVIYYQSCEIDTYFNQMDFLKTQSSFDEIQDSQLLKGTPIRQDFNKDNYRHYVVHTYDFIFDILAKEYELAIIR